MGSPFSCATNFYTEITASIILSSQFSRYLNVPLFSFEGLCRSSKDANLKTENASLPLHDGGAMNFRSFYPLQSIEL